MATNAAKSLTPGAEQQQQQAAASNVTTQEFYVRIPKTKKRYHALKFHIPDFDMTTWSKGEMVRDATNQYVPRQDWESQPKTGQGSEYNKEAKELARRRKFGYMPKKISPDDMPWIVSLKGNEKEKAKEKHYMGKKMITENSCFYIFAKCPDGGFEAHPLEDWYTFTAHKAYKTLNIEEAEEEYKRRHKILNKYLIMANKRKNEGDEGDEEGEAGVTQKGGTKTFSFASTVKAGAGKSGAKSDGEDSDGGKGKKKKSNYKSSNLSDDDEDEDTIVASKSSSSSKKDKNKNKKKTKAAKNSDDEEEIKTKEDSDDGDADGLEKDYSSTGESDLESDHEKEEKYEQKGIDEEEPIKALDKSDDESESEEDEGLTEEGKEYRKLMSKEGGSGGKKENEENEEFSEFFRTGTFKKDPDEDSKDSNLSSGISEFDEDGEIKKSSNGGGSKLKRKATDELGPKGGLKKTNKNSASAPSMGAMTHDESSSSSSTSATPAGKAAAAAAAAASASSSISSTASKSSKTAAVIAAAEAAKQSSSSSSGSKPAASVKHTSTASSSASISNNNSNSIISEEEVRRYLSRKPMTTKELLQKFRGKTQNTLTKEQLLESLRIILDKLHPKMIEKNGVKYLSLS